MNPSRTDFTPFTVRVRLWLASRSHSPLIVNSKVLFLSGRTRRSAFSVLKKGWGLVDAEKSNTSAPFACRTRWLSALNRHVTSIGIVPSAFEMTT